MTDFIMTAHASSNGVPSKRPRRRRPTVFTDLQLRILETVFNDNQYPDITTREQLASSLQLKEDRIMVWFQNRRARVRRASLVSCSAHQPQVEKDVDNPRRQPSNEVDLSFVRRKRKTLCDVDEVNQTTPPTKKLGVVSSKFSVDFLAESSRSTSESTTVSSDPHLQCHGVTQLHRTTSRDSTKGATTSPLMSVDFLSRSSRSPPSRAEYLHRTPSSFYTPMSYHPYVFCINF
ncbi:homeobox protein ceh-37-like [Lytechinus variegatus]|uniref:homeobox protein ceh-37-like n=1 Tax=Lytechinus variegatus TaxID=7654 RepID=UPI001BB206E1|nr:homeobox protein ceh-37-like [Lytechinus variegatus]